MTQISRRTVLAGGAAAAGSVLFPASGGALQDGRKAVRVGRLKQAVARWCFNKIPLPEFCKAAAEMGLTGIDLLDLSEWDIAREYGLAVSVGKVGAGTLTDGLSSRDNHDGIVKAFEETIPKAAQAEVPNVICFFGNRRGMTDAEGIDNSVACLNRCKKIAEEHNVTIVIELLNSKVDHKDYIGDRTSYGLQVVKAVDSPRVKLLYDIYHMQIMEGDVIRTIRENHAHIAHYHTGGVPGRGEIDDTQELNYRAIAKAIVETGFTGTCAHEFVPKKPDPLQSLRDAVVICDV